MQYSQPGLNGANETARWQWQSRKAEAKPSVEYTLPEPHETLAIALQLLADGHVARADALLTAATLDDPSDPELWLATGICRMRRGAIRAAATAFEMAAWLSDDQEARDLCDLCNLFDF